LIVASVGLRQDLIDNIVFSEIVLVVLATTLLTPLMLRWAYSRAQGRDAPVQARTPGGPPRRVERPPTSKGDKA
jgi:hypothetical protein